MNETMETHDNIREVYGLPEPRNFRYVEALDCDHYVIVRGFRPIYVEGNELQTAVWWRDYGSVNDGHWGDSIRFIKP